MCNHYRNDPKIRAELQSWREYIAWSLTPRQADPGSIAGVGALAASDVWPGRQAMVVTNSADGAVATTMAWGVPLSLPGKRPGTSVTKKVTNVRNLASPFWRSTLAAPAQRCLVPFTAFAEPKPGAGRAEAWFTVANEPVAAFAGIWRSGPDGAPVFAFLTCAPNPLVAATHPKAMPVILPPDSYRDWLDGSDAEALAQPLPSQLMRIVDEPPA